VTARDAVDARIEGLDSGADDYLVKPFDFGELLARLRAIIRRGRQPPLADRIAIGSLTLDTRGRRALVGTRHLALTAAEDALLRAARGRCRRPSERRREGGDGKPRSPPQPRRPIPPAAGAKKRRGGPSPADPHASGRRLPGDQMIGRAIGSLSLRARLTIWYSLALLAVVGTFATTVIWQQGRIGMRRGGRGVGSPPAAPADPVRPPPPPHSPPPHPA